MKPHLRDLFNEINTGFPSLRDWQDKFTDIWVSLGNNELIGLRSPTGSGKTLIGLLILAQGLKNKLRCVYLTHTWQLMHRIGEEAERLGIDYFIFGKATGVVGDKRRERDDKILGFTRGNIIFISNFNAFLTTKDFPEEIDILIIDDVDIFYQKLRDHFSVKIRNKGITKPIYEKIIQSLSHRNYSILKKIKEGTAQFEDGNILFPQDYSIIEKIIEENSRVLNQENNFRYPYVVSRNYLDFYLYFLNKNELSIEPVIFPTHQLKIPNSNELKFDKIKKIILLSATLGNEELFVNEIGLVKNKIKLIDETTFKNEGIDIKMGGKLVFPINDTRLDEVFPLETDFVKVSFEFIVQLFHKFNKVLILCWSMTEKLELYNLLTKKISGIKTYDFRGDNYEVINEFSSSPNDQKSCLLIAHRYFGLDFPSNSCECCIITRLPIYLNNYDLMLDKFLKDRFYYNELQKRIITQSLGRINRDENDYTVYFILDNRFKNSYIAYKGFYSYLDKELNLTIDFSYRESNSGDFEKSLEIAKDFINDRNDIRKRLKEFLNNETIRENDEIKISLELLKQIYEFEGIDWKNLYEHKYLRSIENFEKIINILSKKSKRVEYKRKIEWYNFVIYNMLFRLEKRAEKDYMPLLKEYENKVIDSGELTWLNEMSLYTTDEIKIKKVKLPEISPLTRKQFENYAKNPREFLGKLSDLEEVKKSMTVIRDVLKNIAQGQVEAPVRSLAIETERICKLVLKKRFPEIYDDLESEKKLVISEILNVLNSRRYLRKSVFDELNNNLRNLRNLITHTKEEIKDLADTIKKCNNLKEGISLLLKDVYFSKILRESKNIIKDLKKYDLYKYKDDNELKTRILNWWQNESAEFDPKIDDYPEIISYKGTMKIEKSGQEIILEINIVL